MFVSAEKLYVCCIKMREREKGGERKKETDLKLEKKTFQSLGTPCRTCSQQVAYSQINCHESPICKWCKEQVRCLSSNSKEPNMDKLRDKLGEISGMELSSF